MHVTKRLVLCAGVVLGGVDMATTTAMAAMAVDGATMGGMASKYSCSHSLHVIFGALPC